MGKLYVIEGCDGSGKQTQSTRIAKHLKEMGKKVKLISFPRYDKDSSLFVRRYLGGIYGDHPEDVNAYTASLFYALDREDAWLTELKDFYEEGGILIADRYTPSNMIHQASKIDHPEERKAFLEWLEDLEYNKINLPKPNIVFFLDLDPAISSRLIDSRAKQENLQKDIHEKDQAYLKKSYERSQELIDQFGWVRIDCSKKGKILPIEAIEQKILSVIVEETENV